MSFLYFPPRLIQADDAIADPTERMDAAVEKYLNLCIALLMHEESVKDAQKVIAFSRQFKDLEP